MSVPNNPGIRGIAWYSRRRAYIDDTRTFAARDGYAPLRTIMHARDDNAARDDIRTYRSAELPACTAEELQMGNAFCNDAPRLRREERAARAAGHRDRR